MTIFHGVLVVGFLAALSVFFWQMWLSHKRFTLAREVHRMIYQRKCAEADRQMYLSSHRGVLKTKQAVCSDKDGYVVAADPWD